MHWSNVLRRLSVLAVVAVVSLPAVMDLAALAESQHDLAVAGVPLSTAFSVPTTRVIELELGENQRTQNAKTIRATQGELIEFRWRSDHPVALHLHGYDLERRSEPNSDGRMNFKATLEGRFALETHAEVGVTEEVIAYLEVYPE